jgi:hypothetical protein
MDRRCMAKHRISGDCVIEVVDHQLVLGRCLHSAEVTIQPALQLFH